MLYYIFILLIITETRIINYRFNAAIGHRPQTNDSKIVPQK